MATVNLVTTCIGQYNSMRIGRGSSVGSLCSCVERTAIGVGATAEGYGSGATAIGSSAVASADHSTAVGAYANARQANSTAVGANSSTGGGCGTTSVGAYADACGSNEAVVVGYSATVKGDRTVAIGAVSSAMSCHSVAVGASATSDGDYSLAIGSDSYAASRSVVIGSNARATYGREVVIKSGCADDGEGGWSSTCHYGAAGLKIKGSSGCETDAVQFAVNGKLVTMTGCDFRKMLVNAGGTVTTL